MPGPSPVVEPTKPNFIALAIMITAAATLHANNITDIQTSAQAAEALRPVAGPLAETIFALGVIGTGMLSVPVLAESAAYAVGEARKWPTGLARQPMEAKAFYAVICIAMIVGMIMNVTPIDPIRALYWSAVINGVVAVPVMAIMMWLVAAPKVMGRVRRFRRGQGARLDGNRGHGARRGGDVGDFVRNRELPGLAPAWLREAIERLERMLEI